ncbi:LOW QUALITY PROTEIN: hypothetical protein YC2023_043901 [Brassica napus]
MVEFFKRHQKKRERERGRSVLGPAYSRRVSERAVAGTLCSSVRDNHPASPSLPLHDRLVGALSHPSVTTRGVNRHLWWCFGWSNDAIVGSFSVVKSVFSLGFVSGRWRLIQLHRRRSCSREAEAS